MVGMIVLFVLFAAVVFIYSHFKIKWKKEETKNIDSVRDFHERHERINGRSKTSAKKPGAPYNDYVNKYNSSEDYRDKW